MKQSSSLISVCVVDIGSPLQGNIGWAIGCDKNNIEIGTELDDAIILISEALKNGPVILGLEAPLFVPIRPNLIDATRARKGEERRPWSAGAGAQVLTMNLPIMTYFLKGIYANAPDLNVALNPDSFEYAPNNMMVFEALVSGIDKGKTHMDDARIMTTYCLSYTQENQLPKTILREETGVGYMNLVAASLLYTGISKDIEDLHQVSPIYKPSDFSL